MCLQHAGEIKTGSRFAFGENWSRFLTELDDERIAQAERSLCGMLKVKTLQGKRFLDIGSGSGLFSLAARRLGATVFSFDYDPQSVACTNDLKRRYFPDDLDWKVEQGSALDENHIAQLGWYDVVILGAYCTTPGKCSKHWRMSYLRWRTAVNFLLQSITTKDSQASTGLWSKKPTTKTSWQGI